MTLYMIRHATTVQDADVSSHAWVVSADGRDRARRLARRLASQTRLTHVYTSTEAKAVETGMITASELGIPCHQSEGLEEQKRHTAPYFPTQAEFQAAVARLFAHPHELVFGEETADQASTRFCEAIGQLSKQHPAEEIAVIAHGTVLSLFVARHNPDIDTFEFWRKLTMPDCYVLARPGFELQQRITFEAFTAEHGDTTGDDGRR